MYIKKILSFLLSLSVIAGCIPTNFAFGATDKMTRRVYLHAQEQNPTSTENITTVYTDTDTDIYFAVDNPNRGDYINGEHTEPQYDLNGYTVAIYFDGDYFSFKEGCNAKCPIEYDIQNSGLRDEGSKEENIGGSSVSTPVDIGYWVYPNKTGSSTATVNGKNYQKAYITVFFSGDYLPQKRDGEDYWYDLCKLPLTPTGKTGSTEVFVDTLGLDEDTKLELFAKNNPKVESNPTFTYMAVNGGKHTIEIKEKGIPSAPAANPSGGSYDEGQKVKLTAEEGCKIYYSINGGEFKLYLQEEISVDYTTTITCYAQRASGKKSNTVSYEYKILPKAPCLFIEENGSKKLIPNSYSEGSAFTVYVAAGEIFDDLESGSDIYYTFSDASVENIDQWEVLSKPAQKIKITKNTKIRLVTKKLDKYSEVSDYSLGIQPAAPTSTVSPGIYQETKLDIELKTTTENAEIYYTFDEKDPRTDGILYSGPITLTKDTTMRAVSKYDGIFSEISSFYYIFTKKDDFGVEAFYPEGGYEGSVNVTLTANNPENEIQYSTDSGATWQKYEKTLVITEDTTILAKAGKGTNWGSEPYDTFTYKIKPRPPVFSPGSSQFTSTGTVSVYCDEITNETKGKFKLFYTLDGSDPITNPERIEGDILASAKIEGITKYTVIKAVILKNDVTYSSVVTHSYDVVTAKPVKPLTTLSPGHYTRKITDETGFETKFIPVSGNTKIYYTISYDGTFKADPIPNAVGIEYDGKAIEVKGHTIIKAVAVDAFGVKSDVGIFEYIVTPEAPKSAPSAIISGSELPVVPVSAVKGSIVKYEINDLNVEFKCENGSFYIDTRNGKAYSDKECNSPLTTTSTGVYTQSDKTAILNIWAELDGVESMKNQYTYKLNADNTLAVPYADKETGEYEEISRDADDNLLIIRLYSLNNGDTIQYRINNENGWNTYNDGEEIKIKKDTVLQLRSEKDGNYSAVASYVYSFVPLAPIIDPESGSYVLSDNKSVTISYDSRVPANKVSDYEILYRENGETSDTLYRGTSIRIWHTMSFKAYVKNKETGRVSKNAINYYIIESESTAGGSVYIDEPFSKKMRDNKGRMNASDLGKMDFAKGIKLFTHNHNAEIHYSYSYTMKGSTDDIEVENLVYNNVPIAVNPQMTGMTISAWLVDENGKIQNSDSEYKIEFVHLEIPRTSLGETGQYSENSEYSLINEYGNNGNTFIYYTIGTDNTTDPETEGILWEDTNEPFKLTGKTTLRARYMSACGTCYECKNENKAGCWYKVYGDMGEYTYTVPTVQYVSGGSGGGGGGSHTVDKTRKYTKDIFGNEASTHISYINGYPDGSVQPDGSITREEITSVLYRIASHKYEKPSVATGDVFPDVESERWSAHDIEYMAEKEIVTGYPDGEFKPLGKLTRAEFATLICRFAELEKAEDEKNPFGDLEETHWAYEYILSLVKSGLVEGYEDGTFRPENEITRAEVMTVINKILGRNPSETYVKTLKLNPYTDLSADKWYYTAVMEATVTHDYYLDKNGVEEKWENWK